MMRNSCRRFIALACTALAVTLSAPDSTAQAAEPAVALRMTTLRFVISDCPPGCTVQVWHSTIYAPTHLVPTSQVLASVRVRHARAVVRVPTAVTHGLFFMVSDTAKHQAGEGEVGVALRYAGFPVGQTVTAGQSDRAKLGADCWAGTRRADVTFRFKAKVFRSIVNGFKDESMRVWASPGVRTFGPMAQTFHGGLPKQDNDC